MKSILFTALVGVMALAACSDEVRVQLDIVDADNYSRIYMSQANNTPNMQGIFITSDVQYLPVTAFYGGPQKAEKDIRVEFEVRLDLVDEYNNNHGTDYEPMPDGSYSFMESKSTIKSGKSVSEPVNVEILAEKHLAVAKSYMLPVGIKQTSERESIVESLRVTYFVLTGSYLPGQVPREKVYSFGQEVTKPIFCRNQDLIRIDEDDNLQVYKLQEDGTYGAPRRIGQGWGGVDFMFYLPDNRFVCRNPWLNLTQYYIDEDYNFGFQRDIGWGWNNNKSIFAFKDLAILSVHDGGNLVKYPINQNGDFDFGNISDIESTGWGNYSQVLSYENNIIAVESNGNMWIMPLTDSFQAGTRRKIGTGWDIYNKIFQCGEDLLAVDKNGDLWRYEFNPTAFWPLKGEEPAE